MTSSVPDFLFKILLMGDSGVGKSCLMLRHFDDAFTEAYIHTTALESKVRTIVLGDTTVKLHVWDTSAPLIRRYPTTYRGARGILVVFDTTDLESFMSVKQRWLPEIECYAHEEVILTLVGTKLDLSSRRVVPTEEAQLFADQMGIDYWETSSKLGINVDAAFMDLAWQIMLRDFKPVTLLPAPTALQRAVSFVRKALSRNGDEDDVDRRADVEALRQAAIEGRLSDAHRLLEEDTRADVAASADFNRALRLAAAHGHSALVDRLLRDQRVDPSAQSNGALRCAAFNGHLATPRR
jgi:Ras-related protein Rab-1A